MGQLGKKTEDGFVAFLITPTFGIYSFFNEECLEQVDVQYTCVQGNKYIFIANTEHLCNIAYYS